MRHELPSSYTVHTFRNTFLPALLCRIGIYFCRMKESRSKHSPLKCIGARVAAHNLFVILHSGMHVKVLLNNIPTLPASSADFSLDKHFRPASVINHHK